MSVSIKKTNYAILAILILANHITSKIDILPYRANTVEMKDDITFNLTPVISSISSFKDLEFSTNIGEVNWGVKYVENELFSD
jgi:hypothetical protein